MSLNIKFTNAGKAALVNPENIGTEALNITHIDLGTATYNPDGTETNLQAGFKTLSTFGADTVADDVIHVTIRDDSGDVYSLGEIGLRSGTGVLMGVISTQGEVITQKGPNDILLLSADATITEVDITNLTFGGTEFIYPPATPTTQGVIEVADESEVDAGTPNKAVDPYELQQLLTRRLTASLTDPSTTKLAAAKAVYDLNTAINNINTLLISDTATLDTLQEIVDFIELNRSDLDSLTIASIAGLQTALNSKSDGSHSHAWEGITGKPSTFPSSLHNHAISEVTGLQAALDAGAVDLGNLTAVWSGSATSIGVNSFDQGLYLVKLAMGASGLIYLIPNVTCMNSIHSLSGATYSIYKYSSGAGNMSVINNSGSSMTISNIYKVG